MGVPTTKKNVRMRRSVENSHWNFSKWIIGVVTSPPRGCIAKEPQDKWYVWPMCHGQLIARDGRGVGRGHGAGLHGAAQANRCGTIY
jgi:hypothetical protein